jgi:hypothetical protein
VWLDNIDRFRPQLFENKEALRPRLNENGPTLFKNSLKTLNLESSRSPLLRA